MVFLFGWVFFFHLALIIKPSKTLELFLYSFFRANFIFLSQWTKKNGLHSSHWKRFGRYMSALRSLFLKKYKSLSAVWKVVHCQKFDCVCATNTIWD